MRRKLLFIVALVWLLNSAFLNDAGAQEVPVPIWHTTLDDVSSITVDGGEVVGPPADFVPGAIDNAFAGNGSVYATWDDSEVGAIFSDWDDSAGWTVDLYFQGDHWGYVIPDVMPWARKTSGVLAHDQRYQWNLRAFDEGQDGDMTHYWPRMRDMCSYAKSKDMLVGITMFTGWSKHDYSWIFHPLNVNNGGHLTNKEDAVIIASPGTEVWQEPWSDSWSNAKRTQWIWEQFSIKFINELGSMGNVFFVFFDEHSYSEGNMGDHFLNFFKSRGQIWVDWNNRRSSVAWVMSGTLHSTDKNSHAVSGFKGSPTKPYLNLEGEPYRGDHVRTAIWTLSTGGGHYFFHADAGQETVRTGIMGYDPCVPNGDKGMDKRDWLGHASRFFNEHVEDLDTLAPHNELTSSGTYCLANPGREYVIYSKVGSSATFYVNLDGTAGKTLDCRFYDPRNGQFKATFHRTGGGRSGSFTKPDTNDWVLHIVLTKP